MLGHDLHGVPLLAQDRQDLVDVVLVARLDNLGKGASGAAVQNIGLMLGVDVARALPLAAE